ncbi:LysR family transcriptional regulator [Rhizobium sp. BE258]|uniref:LysR family transcriptional regulator n=1 Tax=Rhizobium sp. BE258 TaxID=2817722 RepID=UPI000DDA862A|nr:LysR family transcriptional regulator [Rhizobium sp. BE258]
MCNSTYDATFNFCFRGLRVEMDRLDIIELFLRVASSGNFTKAAREIGISQPTVSRHMAELEGRLGTALLRRSARGVSLTEAGRDYYKSALGILRDLEDCEARVSEHRVRPQGSLSVSVPGGLAKELIVPFLNDFLTEHPKIRLHLNPQIAEVNTIDGGYDLIVRIGLPGDGSLISRRVGFTSMVTVASPSLVDVIPTITRVEDLRGHNLIYWDQDANSSAWKFSQDGDDVDFPIKPAILSGDADLICAAAERGLGIANGPRWLFDQSLREGLLVEVLPQLPRTPLPIFALWRGPRQPPLRTKVFVDFLSRALGSSVVAPAAKHLRIAHSQ